MAKKRKSKKKTRRRKKRKGLKKILLQNSRFQRTGSNQGFSISKMITRAMNS
jgi:hypothetical protein